MEVKRQMIDILRYFRQFYQRNSISVDSVSQREFGVGIDKKINYRHKAFSNQREFQNFLVAEAPRYISHSVGRFEFPWCQPMEKKSLLSADLVFDLDAKPEENHNNIFCTNCVERAKQDVLRLLEKFLFTEFGLSKEDVLVVFSGSKGFHVHVRVSAVQQLSSTSRRLLVDYITGKELSVESLVFEEAISGKKYALAGPDKSSTAGWKSHFLQEALEAVLNNKLDLPKKQAAFFEQHRQEVVERMQRGNWDDFHYCPEVLSAMLQRTVEKHGVQVDSPVTFDVHRLIRVPGTLHGDTGFVAKPLSITELSSFSATKHAAAFTGSAAVNLKEPANIEFAGQAFELKAGDIEVPLSLAVLLACKAATI